MNETLEYVTTFDGRKWSSSAVEELQTTLASVLQQRNRVQLELDLLRGKIHLLDVNTL